MALPTDAQERKDTPIYSGVLKYFPDAIAEVARVSKAGNDQHNPGQPMHWAREKSKDHHDCIVRHLIDAGTMDSDGVRHSAKVAWRALAALQLELEAANLQKCQEVLKDSEDWIAADPNFPPQCISYERKWSNGDIVLGGEIPIAEWASCCTPVAGFPYITHWRPLKEQ